MFLDRWMINFLIWKMFIKEIKLKLWLRYFYEKIVGFFIGICVFCFFNGMKWEIIGYLKLIIYKGN